MTPSTTKIKIKHKTKWSVGCQERCWMMVLLHYFLSIAFSLPSFPGCVWSFIFLFFSPLSFMEKDRKHRQMRKGAFEESPSQTTVLVTTGEDSLLGNDPICIASQGSCESRTSGLFLFAAFSLSQARELTDLPGET